VVDHVGADLIAQKGKNRYAVSVKTRRYPPQSTENRALDIQATHLDLLDGFARRFDLQSIVAQVQCVNKEGLMHVFLMTPDLVRRRFRKAKDGFRWNINKQRDLDALKSIKTVSYALFREEELRVALEPTE